MMPLQVHLMKLNLLSKYFASLLRLQGVVVELLSCLLEFSVIIRIEVAWKSHLELFCIFVCQFLKRF